MNIKEDEVWLLNEVAFEFDSFCCVELEDCLFLALSFGKRSPLLSFLLRNLCRLLLVKLLNQWFTGIVRDCIGSCLKLETILVLFSVSFESNTAREVRLIRIHLIVIIIAFFVDAEEVLALNRSLISTVFSILIGARWNLRIVAILFVVRVEVR